MRTRCRPLLGTFVEISAPPEAAEAVDGAFAAIARMQRHMSFHDDASDLARLRRTLPGTVVEVAPETAEVLSIALDLHRESGGLFDVTIGSELMRAGFLPRRRGWSFSGETGRSSDIEVVGERLVCCHRPVAIDLGGIAKGYAVDKAIEALQAAGVSQALVNAGGDLRMFGPRHWPVALRDGDGIVRDTVRLADCAAASSANLLTRRRRWGRVRTPHIGFGRKPVVVPGRVTVIAGRCVIADAMTKIAMADRRLAERMLARCGGRVLAQAEQEMAA